MSSPLPEHQVAENPPHRSEIWYQDGSVVLQTQNTQFRVYWGTLTQESSFFRDAKSLPQPPDQPTVDGCPVIELYDDLTDIESLLKALFFPNFLAQSALPLSVIGALLRLGRKYDFSDLLNTAVDCLMFENPTTLEEYDALPVPYRPSRIIYYPGLLFDVISLAREYNLQSILPCAYYRAVAFHTLTDFFDGVSREDGTTASLAPVDLRRCTLNRDQLLKVRFTKGYTFGWLRRWDYDSDCTNKLKCTQARCRRLHFYMEGTRILKRNKAEDDKPFCPKCQQHGSELTNAGRKKMWEDFPKIFDLPPWSELTNDL
ncbi:hypothetical protein DFH06DRAFT_1182185 [Mycena polygramma]|nr:hypothetical protein DFH06DRAFT_1182185 [Mycena polygramma]